MLETMLLQALYGLPWAMFVLSIILFILFVYVRIFRRHIKSSSSSYLPVYESSPRRIAFLIASKNGSQTIAEVITAARIDKKNVFVVSDGSTDGTARIAKQAGAKVLALRKNIGKPSALHRAYKHFNLSKSYDAIAILDDDVLVEKNFINEIKKTMQGSNVIAVGRNISRWPHDKSWNIWIASRVYGYWSYQLTLRNIQSSYNVMNCISGSNSLYRTEVLDMVLHANTPYIVDDTYWTLETHRLQLGSIAYADSAKAYIQDPSTFKDWYKQNIRWMWGTYQGIIGHGIGTKLNLFHMSYIALMTQWVFYVLSAPVLVYIIIVGGLEKLPLQLLIIFAGYGMWVVAAATSLKERRLVMFIPAIVLCDILFRVIMVHALFKALNQKTVKSCVWDSPKRFSKTAI